MARGTPGPVRDLLAARDARGGDQRRPRAPAAPPGTGASRRCAWTARSARPRSRRTRPCRSSRRRARRPRRRGSAAAARPSRRCPRAPSGGSGRGRGCAAGRGRSAAARRRRSPRPAAPRRACALRDAAVAEQLHVLLAQRQQAGRLEPVIERRRPASRSVSASAFAVASSSRPLEIDARPQQPRALQPHVVARGVEQLDRRAADAGLGEGREGVGEEDDLAAVAVLRGARLPVPADQRLALEARQRPPARRSRRRCSSRRRGTGRFDSGAVAEPSRLSVRIEPNSRERSGVPWIAL